MSLRFSTLDVFTDRPFGGNPLAVLCDQPALSDAAMQTIAREFNLSETVFILPPRDPRALRSLRIFTPTRELPFAGHPTIGAAHVLVDAGIVTEGDFAQALSCGMPFLFVPVRDRAVLARAQPVSGAWNEAMRGYWAQEVFVFCRDPELPGSHIRARMFAPELGIVEDPATGGAAAAFAGYLAKHEPPGTGTLRWRVEQGFEMGRPSLLYVEADTNAGAVSAVRVGGTAVTMSEGTLRAPAPDDVSLSGQEL